MNDDVFFVVVERVRNKSMEKFRDSAPGDSNPIPF